VVSTAVEEQVPDFAAARARGVPIVHRSELLAHFVATHRTLAVARAPAASPPLVAMIFEILRGAGRDPSVITGGDPGGAPARGPVGQCLGGRSDLLVVEADESDGSLVRYEPAVGVVLNLQRDHREMDEVAAMVRDLRGTHARDRDRGGALADSFPGATRFGTGPARLGRGGACGAAARRQSASRSRVFASCFRCRAATTSRTRSPPSPRAGRSTSACRHGRAARELRGVGRRFQSLRPGEGRGG